MRLNIDNSDYGNQTNIVSDYAVSPKHTDGITDQDETEYMNSRWNQQWGYFNDVPDLKAALLLKAVWNVGKGWTASPEVAVILDHISGWGKDTFKDILFNMEVIKRVGGDAYAEIIRADNGTIINLKPLDPGSMKIIVDGKGIIKRYEQVNKTSEKGQVVTEFKPEDIFHLSHNRLADQIHGISDIDALEKTILADEESQEDIKKLMHHQLRPFIIWKLKTDDQAKIANFKLKIDTAKKYGEDMFIPDDDDAVEHEIVQVNLSAVALEWRADMRGKFYRNIMLPQIVPGAGGNSTESESKVIYLAFEQIVENDQSNNEGQIWNQLQLKINLYPPASLQQPMQADEGKDVLGAGQPSDLTAGVGR